MGCLVERDIYIYKYLYTYTELFVFWFRYVVLSAICFLPTEIGQVIKFTSRETRVHKNPPIFTSIPHDDHQFARSQIFLSKISWQRIPPFFWGLSCDIRVLYSFLKESCGHSMKLPLRGNAAYVFFSPTLILLARIKSDFLLVPYLFVRNTSSI